VKRFEASGWDDHAVDGHDPDAIAARISARARSRPPVA
jgi:transketolase